MHFLLRRIIFYLVALWAAITLNFAIPRLMPGNPAEAIYAQHAMALKDNPNALRAIETSLGLSNDPMPIQYVHYLGDLLHGNLGLSFSLYPATVSSVIGAALPWTLFLVGLAALISFFLGTGLGVLAAWRRGGFLDSVLPPLTLLTSSFPYFFLAMLLLYVLGVQLQWFPTSHSYTVGTVPNFSLSFIGDALAHAIMPALAIVVVTIGGWLLGMRNVMINTLSEDYITMAQAKGLTDRRVMLAYAARNALLPQITGFAVSLGLLIGGQVVVEIVFSYQGVGFLFANALTSEDYPLIQALLLVITIGVLVANFVADLVYARLDPRVRSS